MAPTEFSRALGAVEAARRERVEQALRDSFAERTNARLASAGYRLANGAEPGAHFAWFAIDDRPMDGGLCKLWVVRCPAKT